MFSTIYKLEFPCPLFWSHSGNIAVYHNMWHDHAGTLPRKLLQDDFDTSRNLTSGEKGRDLNQGPSSWLFAKWKFQSFSTSLITECANLVDSLEWVWGLWFQVHSAFKSWKDPLHRWNWSSNQNQEIRQITWNAFFRFERLWMSKSKSKSLCSIWLGTGLWRNPVPICNDIQGERIVLATPKSSCQS